MATSSSTLFSADDVVGFLDSSFTTDGDTHLAGLFDESDDDTEAIRDYINADGTHTFVSEEMFSISSMIAISQANNHPLPCEMDSLLNLDTDLNDGKFILYKIINFILARRGTNK